MDKHPNPNHPSNRPKPQTFPPPKIGQHMRPWSVRRLYTDMTEQDRQKNRAAHRRWMRRDA